MAIRGTEVGSLHYDLNIDDKKLHSQLDSADNKLRGFGDGISKVGKTLVAGFAIAGAAAVGFAVSAVKSFSESENAIAQTNAVLKSTGGIAGVTAEMVDELASSLQKSTRYSDEQIRSAENMLLTFTNVGKKVFPDATKAILDMSTAMGTDLKGTAIQVGKALQDPIQGVTALQRVGVRLTETQKDLVKSLVEAGKVEEAQTLILKELQTEFGGSAEAAGNTFAGALDKLKNRFDDVKEGIGKVIVVGLTPLFNKLADFVNSDKFKAWIENLTLWLQTNLPIAIDYIANTMLPKMKQVFDDMYPVIKTTFDILSSLFLWLLDHEYILYGIAAAFVAIKTAIMVNGVITALSAFGSSMGAVVAAAPAMGAALLAAIPAALLVAAAAVAVAAIWSVWDASKKLQGELEKTKSAMQDLGESKGEYVKSLGDALRAGRINKSTYDQRLGAYNASMNSIPKRAMGGPVTAGRSYIVGEQGQELFTPKQDGFITPNGGSPGGGITINIGTINDKSDVDYLMRRLDRNQERVSLGMSPA